MQNVTFFFDPICPFSWITSRWLIRVSQHQSLNIDWQPFSLALKNANKAQSTDSHESQSHQSLRLLRVMQQAKDSHQADIGQLYTIAGQAHHLHHKDYDNQLIADTLSQLILPSQLLQSADDTSLDATLQQAIDRATSTLGNDIGVPTILIDQQGTQVGFNGPILQSLPGPEESVAIWQSIASLAAIPSFYKISRPLHQPLNLISTKDSSS